MDPINLDKQARQALLQRVKDILLRPRPTWEQIDGEDGSARRIYTSYLIFLAAIPAIAGFIGTSLVGISGFGLTMRVPVLQGLANMVVNYVLSLVFVYVLALIANALAPRYQGRQDMGSALKLIAYGATAGMVAGVFSILPSLAVLGGLGGLYSIYLIYTGIPVLMKAPKEKATVYTVVLIVCAIVAMMLMMGVTHLLTPGQRTGLQTSGSATIEVPGTNIKIDSEKLAQAARKLEQAGDGKSTEAAVAAVTGAMGSLLGANANKEPAAPAPGKSQAPRPSGNNASAPGKVTLPGGHQVDEAKLEQAQRKLEEAQSKGDTAAVQGAMKEVAQATFGKAEPLKPQQLREQMPEQMAGLHRGAVKTRSESMMGLQTSELNAVYGEDDKAVNIKIKDMGAAGSSLAGLMALQGFGETEDDTSMQRTYRDGEFTIQENYEKDGSQSRLVIRTTSGMEINAHGAIPMDELKPGVLAIVRKLHAIPRTDG